MNPRQVKAHRGLTNEILFNIRNRDRKLQNVASKTLTVTFVDPETHRHVHSKTLEDTLDLGKVMLVLEGDDWDYLADGTYWAHITQTDLGQTERPLYSNQDNDMRFEFHITDQAASICNVTQEWDNDANSNISMNFNGNGNQNFASSTHTAIVYTEDFTGEVAIQASLVNDIPNAGLLSTDWVTVNTLSLANANITSVTETFSVNCNWIRFVAAPVTGLVTKIQLRN